jgi:hypothetical protein
MNKTTTIQEKLNKNILSIYTYKKIIRVITGNTGIVTQDTQADAKLDFTSLLSSSCTSASQPPFPALSSLVLGVLLTPGRAGWLAESCWHGRMTQL